MDRTYKFSPALQYFTWEWNVFCEHNLCTLGKRLCKSCASIKVEIAHLKQLFRVSLSPKKQFFKNHAELSELLKLYLMSSCQGSQEHPSVFYWSQMGEKNKVHQVPPFVLHEWIKGFAKVCHKAFNHCHTCLKFTASTAGGKKSLWAVVTRSIT